MCWPITGPFLTYKLYYNSLLQSGTALLGTHCCACEGVWVGKGKKVCLWHWTTALNEKSLASFYWVTAPLEKDLKLGRLRVSTRLLVNCPSSSLERDYSLPWKVSQCLWHMVEGISNFIALEGKQISFGKKRKIIVLEYLQEERGSLSVCPVNYFWTKLGSVLSWEGPGKSRNPGTIISQQTFVEMIMSRDGRNLDPFQSPDGGQPLLTHTRLYMSKKSTSVRLKHRDFRPCLSWQLVLIILTKMTLAYINQIILVWEIRQLANI